MPGEEVVLGDIDLEGSTLPEPPKLEEIKLEGDDVPELVRGKSVKDALTTLSRMGDSLKLSEAARQAAQASLDAAAANTRPAPTPTSEVKEPDFKLLSKEELKELYDKDPIAAIEYKTAESQFLIQQNFDKRLGSLAQNTVQSAEQAARTRFPDEFRLFEKEIKEYVAQMPDPSVMGSQRAWDDLVSWVRGRPGNIDRLIDDRVARSASKKQEEAQAAQVAAAGAVITSVGRTPAPSSPSQLDKLQQEIARNLFPDVTEEQAYAEYVKWSKVAQ